MNPGTTSGTQGQNRLHGRILLVEDNDAASQALARLLAAWGFEVTVTHDGAGALGVLDSQPPPDFVLTDLLLPDTDGREIARHAHRLEPTPKVALITGWDIDPVHEDFQSWGIDWVFTKPVDAASLQARLRESIESSSP
jgi:two-component system cell cycle response regulator CpdR